MYKVVCRFIAGALCVAFVGGAQAAGPGQGTADEAVAMVRKVVAYMQANGKEKTITEVNDPHGAFQDRDLYVTLNDMSARTLAHGANPKMQGRDLYDLKDADGKFFMRERLKLAKSNGKGWQDFKPANAAGQVEPNMVYFEKYEDVLVSCGIHK